MNKFTCLNRIQKSADDYIDSHKYKEFKEFLASLNNMSSSKYEKINVALLDLFGKVDSSLILNLFNYLYNDGWDLKSTSIDYSYNCKYGIIATDLMINLKNDYKEINYYIKFGIDNLENVAIIVYREVVSFESKNILSIHTRKNVKVNNIPYIIMLSSKYDVPDNIKSDMIYNGKIFNYEYDIIKCWKYNFNEINESSLYILYTSKVFDLFKGVLNMHDTGVNEDIIKNEIDIFFNRINLNIDKYQNYNFDDKSKKVIMNVSLQIFNELCDSYKNFNNMNINLE